MTARYSRQEVLPQIGPDGQRVLLSSKVAVIGCGALGTHIAANLARAGIGHIRIMDRDIVELNNLQRQTLFDESDVGQTKVEAAGKKLRMINSEITVEALVKDLHNRNIEELIRDFHLVVDATDNIPTRMILNDACIKAGIPWIYAGVIKAEGMVMSILPEGPCLRCLMPDIPPADAMTNCEVAGVINTIPAIIAGIQCTEAFKVLLKKTGEQRRLIVYDVWEHRFHSITVRKNPQCPCCANHTFDFLDSPKRGVSVQLCDNSVQVNPSEDTVLDLQKIAGNLRNAVDVTVVNDYLLRFDAEGKQITLYRDGRALIKGTGDSGIAKAVYSRYLGL
ncbi:MAG: NAD(P)H-binding protein [bacterium]|nr:NAD(P)H-binding protein [bacterium]